MFLKVDGSLDLGIRVVLFLLRALGIILLKRKPVNILASLTPVGSHLTSFPRSEDILCREAICQHFICTELIGTELTETLETICRLPFVSEVFLNFFNPNRT